MLAATIFALNWKGPFTVDNAAVVVRNSVDQVTDYSNQINEWLSPHLKIVREQWRHTSRYVAENGRDLVFIAWDKTKDYAEIVKKQALVTWPVVRQRVVEVSSLTGDVVSRYWAIICQETPIYYEAVVSKVTELYQSFITTTASETKIKKWANSFFRVILLSFFVSFDCFLSLIPNLAGWVHIYFFKVDGCIKKKYTEICADDEMRWF